MKITRRQLRHVIKEELASIQEMMAMPSPNTEEGLDPTAESVWLGFKEIVNSNDTLETLKSAIERMMQDRSDTQLNDIKDAGFFGINLACQMSLAKGKLDISCLVAYIGAIRNLYQNGTEPWLDGLKSWSDSQ
jgi:hypothetical protein